MGWEERRNGRRYYYRYAGKAGGRTVKQYVGAGHEAAAAAADVAARQQERETERDERAQFAAITRTLADQKRIADAAVSSILEAAGYHKHHRGEWRKRRHA